MSSLDSIVREPSIMLLGSDFSKDDVKFARSNTPTTISPAKVAGCVDRTPFAAGDFTSPQCHFFT